LREERTRHLQQLEELERTKALLEKANARVEDLTVQLAAKTEVERQLSWEKSQLENFFQTETKNKTRISMQVEELQWRIKHNKELPPPQVFSPTTPSLSTTGDESSPPPPPPLASSSPASSGLWLPMNHESHPPTEDVNKNEAEQQPLPQKSLARPTTIEGIEPQHVNVPVAHLRRSTSEDSLEENGHHGDYNQNGNVEEDEEEEVDDDEEKEDQSKESDDDAGLSDEGLGDITSEASNSPQPPNPPVSHKAVVNEAFGMPPPKAYDYEKKVPEGIKGNNNYSLPTSPCDERVPSRIPFPKKQHKSQTNL